MKLADPYERINNVHRDQPTPPTRDLRHSGRQGKPVASVSGAPQAPGPADGTGQEGCPAIEHYQPRRIYQWGSLLEPNGFREWSDLDFAVEGLGGPLDGLRAADEASNLTQFPVDLVDLERIHPLHAESIRANGRLIHERD
jgi:predicted nucleotidyltransferase